MWFRSVPKCAGSRRWWCINTWLPYQTAQWLPLIMINCGLSCRNSGHWKQELWPLCFPDGGTKKLRSTIRRSTETGIAVELRNRVTRQGSKDSTDGSTNSNSSDGTWVSTVHPSIHPYICGIHPSNLNPALTLAGLSSLPHAWGPRASSVTFWTD